MEEIRRWILERGPIPAARCSSAKARGKAKNYRYWGAAEYTIRLSKVGLPIAVAVRAARSDRRSLRLACQDAEELAEHLGGVVVSSIGALHLGDIEEVLRWIRRKTPFRRFVEDVFEENPRPQLPY